MPFTNQILPGTGQEGRPPAFGPRSPATRPGLHVEELACIAVLCFYGVAGAIPGIAPNQAAEMTGHTSGMLTTVVGVGSQVIVNVIILLLVLRQLRRLRAVVPAMQWTAAIALLSIVSCAWSQEPLLTLRRSIPFAMAAVFGLYLASRFPLNQQQAILLKAFCALAAGSVIAALLFPAVGLDASTGHAGNWQGVFTQKNACGRAMVFATTAVLSGGRVTAPRASMLAVFAAVLFLSGSRGAWVIGLIMVLVLALFHVLCRLDRPARGWFAAASAGVGMGLLALGVIFFPLLAPLVGRDATLTGRTAIWAQVWRSILQHPWLGYGFSAFWRGVSGASFDVVVALRFVLFHAHNGLLEIWLELGIAGVFLFALSYGRAWRKLWPLMRAGNVQAAAWPLCVLVLIAAYDFDENTLMSFNGLFWVLYVQALVQIELVSRTRPLGTLPRVLRVPSTASDRLFPTGAAWL